eukprot:CAMPEP_0172314556 /NCGR_PEP_ID=MMETSP1058-20130122/22828_1 /TAXON_ID=83371 /ORGANISM="Detonula confervacea, Strain CCMP 353" /LENGTH=521 /DNA_ID=CAMNT_0013028451 /DNA_START=160 /DNA_END=1725 /DNA_ORIENTATION=-
MTKDDKESQGDSENPKTDSNSQIGNNKDGDSSSGDAGNSNTRGVSIAYAGGGRQQPILNNAVSLFQQASQSLSAHAEKLFGSDDSSAGEGDDSNNGKDRKVPCYCLPCLTCGKGEQGRATVRMISTLIFPLFLLSFFLLDDVGRTVMRNIRLRNDIGQGGKVTIKSGITHPVLRRKTLHSFPGVKREILWVPLEHTLSIDSKTAVKASMKCPRGVLFLFHGCNRYAASFFYSPQGRKLVSLAYKAGVEIVAFEKKDEKGCWDWEEDGEPVLKVGRKFMNSRLLGACGTNTNGDESYPPIWAFGASSGGTFVATLAAKMQEEPAKYAPFLFSAINVQIMSPPEDLDWNIPSIFTVMDGDEITKTRVQERVSKKSQGGPFKMIVTSGKKGIHPDHFRQLYHDDKQMSGKVSTSIYQDLFDLGLVDPSNNNQLVGDPRGQLADVVASIWKKYDLVVREETAPADSEDILPYGVSQQLMRPLRVDELRDTNSIWFLEELNVAWDQHEITAEGFEEVLAFFFEYGM